MIVLNDKVSWPCAANNPCHANSDTKMSFNCIGPHTLAFSGCAVVRPPSRESYLEGC
jgi:hypothetical protein